jgi:broad specificity phosphatase PhoE
MGKWYLVRHARTEWNHQGRIQGHAESDLDEVGLVQAQRLAARLATIRIHAAYSSDMRRTRQTGQAILKDRAVPWEETPELRELAYGKWEGMTRPEIAAAHPDVYEEYMKGDLAFVPPGGESPLMILARVRPFVERVRGAHKADEDILVVSHGGTLKALLIALMGLPPDPFWHLSTAHAGLSIITTYPKRATLDLWNDVSHLQAATP